MSRPRGQRVEGTHEALRTALHSDRASSEPILRYNPYPIIHATLLNLEGRHTFHGPLGLDVPTTTIASI